MGVSVLVLGLAALVVVLLMLSGRPNQSSPNQASPTPGTATRVALGDTAASDPAQPTPRPTEQPLRAEVSVMEANYEVQAGDTLGAIARRFDTSIEALRAYNQLEDAARLQIGQRLIVPQGDPAPSR